MVIKIEKPEENRPDRDNSPNRVSEDKCSQDGSIALRHLCAIFLKIASGWQKVLLVYTKKPVGHWWEGFVLQYS